ncbi:MAG: DUF2867 domain-containing protein [Desulfococcaceae bacterium]
MRIVTRPDFDGVVCAALLYEAENITSGIRWTEPNDMQKGMVEIFPGDIVANLPFHKNCALWFDHHYTNRPDIPFQGLYKIAPSAAGVIYEYYKERFTRDYGELIRHTDKIDSADLSLDEVLHPEKYPYVLLSMTLTGSSLSDEPYWNRLAELIRRHSMEDIMQDSEVKKRCDAVVQENTAFKSVVEKHTRLIGHVSITDLRSFAEAPRGNRFLVYSLFPEAIVSMKIRRHREEPDKVIIGVGHSIFNPGCRVNSGLMLSQFGGGGHRGAASCTVSADRADEVISAITEILRANPDNEGGSDTGGITDSAIRQKSGAGRENEVNADTRPVLVTGATGYVGGRLIPLLLEKGFKVRAMGRSVEKMACRTWAGHPNTELVQGDVMDRQSLFSACKGCGAAFYLVHSMIAQKEKYAQADRISAQNMAAAAEETGLERIIYLGGLGDANHQRISPHLRSRHEVGQILQSGKVPVTVLNAAMILGSGSASFEILRYLTHRLPVMITPKWVQTPSQPIAITDVLAYLSGCLEKKETIGQTFDIGGPDVLNYKELITIFAQEAGLPPRKIIPVPFLTPHLSAIWIHLITPVPSSIAVPLTEGLAVPTACRENRIRQIIPLELTGCRAAIRRALDRILEDQVDTCWSDAGDMHAPEWSRCGDAEWAGGTILECGYRVRIQAEAEDIWPAVSRIGGENGYYFGNLLWRLRGLADRLAGGVGLRRGRRHPSKLYTGDALDFWRVLEVSEPERLLLQAEMKMPGEALLDIRILPSGRGSAQLQMLSRFLPYGLSGLVYWYVLYPFHQWIFSGMLKAMSQSIGREIISQPERFTPKLYPTCTLGPEKSRK